MSKKDYTVVGRCEFKRLSIKIYQLDHGGIDVGITIGNEFSRMISCKTMEEALRVQAKAMRTELKAERTKQ